MPLWLSISFIGSSSGSEVPSGSGLVPAQDVLGDQDLVHLIGSVGDAQRARSLIHAGERQIVGDAGCAPDLDGPVDDAVVGGGYEHLDGGDVGPSCGVAAVELLGGVDRHEPSGLDVDVAVGDEPLDQLLVLEQ